MIRWLMIGLLWLSTCLVAYCIGLRFAYRAVGLGCARAYLEYAKGSANTPHGAKEAELEFGKVTDFKVIGTHAQGPLGIPVHVKVSVLRGGTWRDESLAFYSHNMGWPAAVIATDRRN